MDVARVRERHHELELEGEALGLGRPRGSLRGASLVSGQHRARVMWQDPEQQVPSRCASAEAPVKICASSATFGFNNARAEPFARVCVRDPPRRLVMDSKKMYEAVFGKVRADPREGTRGINTTAPFPRQTSSPNISSSFLPPLSFSSTQRDDLVRPPTEPRRPLRSLSPAHRTLAELVVVVQRPGQDLGHQGGGRGEEEGAHRRARSRGCEATRAGWGRGVGRRRRPVARRSRAERCGRRRRRAPRRRRRWIIRGRHAPADPRRARATSRGDAQGEGGTREGARRRG